MNSRTFPRSHALLIGVGGDLPCTVNDVEELRKILVDRQRCGYPPRNVRILAGKNATADNIRAQLRQLAGAIEKEREDSTVMVYFSGHGQRVRSSRGDTYYLLTSGCDCSNSKKLTETCLSGAEFSRLLEGIRAERFLLLLDCCHAGGVDLPKAPGLLLQREAVPSEIHELFGNKKGRAILASSRADEVSLAGSPCSAFTHSLLEAFCGKGASRQDGFVRTSDLALYTREKVAAKTNDAQHPIFDFSKADNFEVAYYGGGDTAPKSLPFSSFVLRQPTSGGASQPVTTNIEVPGISCVGVDESHNASGIRTVVELDLVGYSDVCRTLEENVGTEVVAHFNSQIQEFVDAGLAAIGAARSRVVLSTTGDGAILAFDQPADCHTFAVAVHQATQTHNTARSTASSQRWFRIGAATGQLLQRSRPGGGQEIAGIVIANAVRLETAAKPGQFIVDSATFASLPAEFQARYGAEETVAGKHGERFAARRCTMIPYKDAEESRSTVQSILKLLGDLNPPNQLDMLMTLVGMPQDHRPAPTLTLAERSTKFVDWAFRGGDTMVAKVVASLKDLIRKQQPSNT